MCLKQFLSYYVLYLQRVTNWVKRRVRRYVQAFTKQSYTKIYSMNDTVLGNRVLHDPVEKPVTKRKYRI